MHRASAVLLASLGLAACNLADADVRDSGQKATDGRKVSSFSSIALQGSMDLDVTVGPATSVVVTGDAAIVPLVRTEVRDGRLVIDSRESFRTRQPLVVKISTPSLAGLVVAGSGDSTVRGATGDRLELAVSGSGDVEATGKVGDLAIRVSGSGDIDARSVSAGSASIEVSGSGDIAASAASARARVSGSGDITLTVTEALDAVVSGSGSITYRGNPPKVTRRVSGSGSISPR